MPETDQRLAPPPPMPYLKGWFGVDYRTLISLHHNVGAASSAAQPGDPAWDVWVTALPFLLAPAEGREYQRASTALTRDRFDSARDPGENSLDSNLWLRGWTSWHMGAGQDQAEPLETDAEVARFRFSRSAGVDVWTPGQASLLPRMVAYRPSGVSAVLGVPGRGLLEARSTGVWLDGVQIHTGAVTFLTAGGTYWAGVSDTGTMVYGKYDGTDSGTVAGLSNVSLVAYQKNRFWAVDGPDSLREVPDLKGTPPAAIRFTGARRIIDVDAGVAGLYVMTDEGLTSIYVIGAEDDGSLSAATNVATLPRGESGKFLYGYLGRYMAIGSTKGLRVADTGSGQSLPIGPLVIQMDGIPADVTADGNFLWVTTAGADIDVVADGTVMRPGTYRIDLAHIVESQTYGDTAAARFAYATDQYADSVGVPISLSTFDGLLYLVLADGQLWRTDPTGALVSSGWLETGEITFSTGEFKAWQSVHAEVFGLGSYGAFADSGSGWSPVTQNLIPAPIGGSADIDSRMHPPSGSMNLRFVLAGNAAGSITPVMKSAGVRVLAAAKRTRKISLPLLAFDYEVDRNQTPIGYEGFAYDRIADLEELQESGRILQVLDTRTNETLSCQIDSVSFSSQTPPDRALKNWGGLLQLVLLVV